MSSIRVKLSVSLFTLFCTVGLLGGCDKKSPGASGPDSTASASADDRDQQATLKYNAYVDAANGIGRSFGEALDSYERLNVPDLEKKGPLENYFVENDDEIGHTLENLQKAIALPGPKTDIDAAAQTFAQALQTLAPISHELDTYARSKAYLADQGEKARAKNAAYLAALEKVAAAEDAFTTAVERHDRAQTQAQFQKAKKDSPDYYRLGIIIHARNGMEKMKLLYAHPQDEDKRKAVEAEFNQIQSLLDGYDAQPLGKACLAVNNSVVDYLASGRSILEDIRSGRYAESYRSAHDNSPSSSMEMDSFTQQYSTDFTRQLNDMINTFNTGRC